MKIIEINNLIKSLSEKDAGVIEFYTKKRNELLTEINAKIDLSRLSEIDNKLSTKHWVELSSDGSLAVYNSLVGYTGIKLNN